MFTTAGVSETKERLKVEEATEERMKKETMETGSRGKPGPSCHYPLFPGCKSCGDP